VTAVVLAHSPLTGPVAWGGLPEALRDRGHVVLVLDVRDDDYPPYATRYVARAALQLRAADIAEPVVLVAHSGAGYLLPSLGAARRADRGRISGYVFLDAGLPAARGATRLSLLRAEDEDLATELEASLRAGERFPTWTEHDLRSLVPNDTTRAALVASLRPRGLDFFTEELPYPGDWPDAPCGYVQLTAPYDVAARLAAARGWPVLRPSLPGGHFAACVDPTGVTDALDELLRSL